MSRRHFPDAFNVENQAAGICGKPDERGELGGKLLTLMQKVDLTKSSYDELTGLERACAAITAAARANRRRMEGFTLGKFDKDGPGVTGPADSWELERNGVFDHVYKLKRKGGNSIYVSEPYSLNRHDLEKLLVLMNSGWDCSIRPENALHFPGSTMAIFFKKSTKVKP